MIHICSFQATADPGDNYAMFSGLSQVPSTLGLLELAMVEKK
jgi:hypothetical protein